MADGCGFRCGQATNRVDIWIHCMNQGRSTAPHAMPNHACHGIGVLVKRRTAVCSFCKDIIQAGPKLPRKFQMVHRKPILDVWCHHNVAPARQMPAHDLVVEEIEVESVAECDDRELPTRKGLVIA
jgi:hypothetical protein